MDIMAGHIPLEYQWNQTGQQMMDGSFVDEVQKQQRNLLEMARAEAIKQDPTLSYVQRQIAQGLLGAKQDWQKSYDAGDSAGMANAALRGQSLRERGNAIGWDSRGYGSDVSLIEAAQNLANNDTRAVNDILYNLKDSNDIYRQKVVDYLDKGYSIDSAKRMAGQRSDENTASNINQLRDAFRMYGMNERGAITPQGADILASMAQNGQSELANFYANMMAKPVQNWNFDNELLRAANADRYARGRMELQNSYNTAARREGYAQAENMARLQNDLVIRRMETQARINIQNGIMSKEMGYNWLVSKMVEAGVDEMTARQYAAQSLIGGGNGGAGSQSGYNSKLVGDLQKERDAIASQIESAKLSGDEAAVKALQPRLEAIQARIDSAFGMGGGDGGNVYSEIANDYNKFREFYQKALDDAADDPNITYADIIAHAERVNKEFADNFFDESYRNAKRLGANTEQKGTPKASEPPKQSARPGNVSSSNYNGYQIVVPADVQKAIADNVGSVMEEAVHGNAPVPRAYQHRIN